MQEIQDEKGLLKAQDLFRGSFASLPHRAIRTSIGYQSGSVEADVMWVPSLDIWGYFALPPDDKSSGPRFWNPFGLGEPPPQVSIVCEINPPRLHANPATAGVFLRMDTGATIVAHRCRFTVTGGISADYFLARFKGERILHPTGRKKKALAKVAELGSSSFGHDIAAFIREVHRIKEQKRQENYERRTNRY